MGHLSQGCDRDKEGRRVGGGGVEVFMRVIQQWLCLRWWDPRLAWEPFTRIDWLGVGQV